MPGTVVQSGDRKQSITLLVFKTTEHSDKIMGDGNILFRLKSWFYHFLVVWLWVRLPLFAYA